MAKTFLDDFFVVDIHAPVMHSVPSEYTLLKFKNSVLTNDGWMNFPLMIHHGKKVDVDCSIPPPFHFGNMFCNLQMSKVAISCPIFSHQKFWHGTTKLHDFGTKLVIKYPWQSSIAGGNFQQFSPNPTFHVTKNMDLLGEFQYLLPLKNFKTVFLPQHLVAVVGDHLQLLRSSWLAMESAPRFAAKSFIGKPHVNRQGSLFVYVRVKKFNKLVKLGMERQPSISGRSFPGKVFAVRFLHAKKIRKRPLLPQPDGLLPGCFGEWAIRTRNLTHLHFSLW